MAVNKIFIGTELTHSTWVVLNCISRNPGKSTHALAEACFVTDQSFGQLIAKLAGQGLVERKPGFGKAILHELTDAGRKALVEADPLMERALLELFSVLEGGEQEAMAEMLERVIRQSGNAKMVESLPPEITRK